MRSPPSYFVPSVGRLVPSNSLRTHRTTAPLPLERPATAVAHRPRRLQTTRGTRAPEPPLAAAGDRGSHCFYNSFRLSESTRRPGGVNRCEERSRPLRGVAAGSRAEDRRPLPRAAPDRDQDLSARTAEPGTRLWRKARSDAGIPGDLPLRCRRERQSCVGESREFDGGVGRATPATERVTSAELCGMQSRRKRGALIGQRRGAHADDGGRPHGCTGWSSITRTPSGGSKVNSFEATPSFTRTSWNSTWVTFPTRSDTRVSWTSPVVRSADSSSFS